MMTRKKRTRSLTMGTTLTKMTMKKTKRPFDWPFELFRHPLPPFGHLNSMRRMVPLLALICTANAIPVPESAGRKAAETNLHAHDFVIFATVFAEQGFALTGARMPVHRSHEWK